MRALAGEHHLFGWLANFIGPWLLAWAQVHYSRLPREARCQGDVSDLVQDVWLRALPYIGGSPEFTPLRGSYRRALLGLFGALLRRTATDAARLTSRRPPGSLLETSVQYGGDGPETAAAKREQQQAIDDALLSLDATSRELLLGYFMDRRELKELADELGLSRSNASKKVNRALEWLRAHHPELADAEWDVDESV